MWQGFKEHLKRWPFVYGLVLGVSVSSGVPIPVVLWFQSERMALKDEKIASKEERIRELEEAEGETSSHGSTPKRPFDEAVAYSAKPAREHDSRWITDLATYLHDAAMAAGHNSNDVMAVFLETKPFGHQTPELAIDVAPAQSEYTIESAHYFRRQVSAKAPSYIPVRHTRDNRGHSLSLQPFQEKDVLVGVLVLRKNTADSRFLRPSQLNTAFTITQR